MRLLLMVFGLLLNICVLAQQAQNDFLTFRVKSDSLAKLMDSNAARLVKKIMKGKITNEPFEAYAFINESSNDIYKIIYQLENDIIADKERVFYYYSDHLTRMVIRGKVYYSFGGKILDASGEAISNMFILGILDFEKTARDLAKQIF